MTEEKIDIYYKKWIPFLPAAVTAFTFYVFLFTSQPHLLAIVLMQGLLAFLMFRFPVAEITRTHVRLKNMFGKVMKAYDFSVNDVKITGKKILIRDKAVLSSIWADFNPEDVARFLGKSHRNS